MMAPCKYLDHSDTYAETCELVTLSGFPCDVKHWHRKHVPYEGAPAQVA